jgi:arabinofuranosyltransferase
LKQPIIPTRKSTASGVLGDNRDSEVPRFRILSALCHRILGFQKFFYFFIIVLVFLIHTFHLNVVAEDAFITFQFARNLVNGHGIVWNIGEAPVEGYTNFLWLLLSAFLMKIGLNVTLYTQLFGVAASLVTMSYVYRFGRRMFNLPPGSALIPCLFLAASGPFAAWAGSGMEMNLFGLFLLAGCYYFVGWAQFDSWKDLLKCLLMLFLATLTRPEGFMIFGLVAVLGMTFTLLRSRRDRLQYILSLLVYVIPFLIYFFWRYSYFGFLLPNTFYAKTGGNFYQFLRGLKYSSLFAFHFLLPLLPLYFTFVWENGFEVSGRAIRWRAFIPHLKAHLNIYLGILVSAVYSLYIVYVGGDYMAMYRFFVPILPFFYLLLGPITSYLFQHSAVISYKRLMTRSLIAFAIGMTILQSTAIETRLFRKPEFMHGTYQGIQYERWHVTRYKVISNFFRGYKHSDQESIALGPIGIISFYSDMIIYSVFGIVDTQIAHKKMSGLGQGFPGHEKSDLPYVLSKRPTYFIFSLSLRSEPESFPNYSGEVGEILQENYQLQSVWLDDHVNGEAGYFTFLEAKTRKQ